MLNEGRPAGMAWLAKGSLVVLLSPCSVMAADNQLAVPVVSALVARADVPVFLTGLGTVQAYNSVVITSRVDGQIVKIDFGEGQEVHAGDVVVEIDPAPYKAALAQAEAAKLRDQAQLDNARRDLDRAQHLATTGAGTTQQFDTAKSQVAQFAAGIAADEAAIEAARVQLNYTQIRSPIDGRTGTRQIDIGNIVRASSTAPIVTINQVHPISVALDLPADSLLAIRTRMKSGTIAVSALDRNDHILATGRLSVVDNQVNIATGTIRYKATFDNTDESLWPGEFVTVRVLVETRRNAVVVPPTAVLRGASDTYAFVVAPDHVIEKRPIKVDFANPEVAAIAFGLTPGERVVVDGQYRIQAGTLVTVTPSPPQPRNDQGT